MFAAITLVLLHRGSYGLTPELPSGALFEEEVSVQSFPGYHPMIRFSSWDITRFTRNTTYQFMTPDMIQQGQFRSQDDYYSFRAVMANEIENSDKMKIMEEIGPGYAQDFDKTYARSMYNFEGSYNRKTGALTIAYPYKGVLTRYVLYDTTQGDRDRAVAVGDNERFLIGFWHQPEPFPEKLDARTRQKIQENGLKIFMKEAGASEGAMFNVLDLRADRTFRCHAKTGTWNIVDGNVLVLHSDREVKFGITRDGKLVQGGKVAYTRS